MLAIYLWTNAALYIIFAVWMTVLPWQTSAAIGYTALSASGKSEYLVIYGGLQVGLAAFFAWCAWQETLHRTGIVFAICLYTPIVIYRAGTVMRFWPVSMVTVSVAVLEAALWIGAVALLAYGAR